MNAHHIVEISLLVEWGFLIARGRGLGSSSRRLAVGTKPIDTLSIQDTVDDHTKHGAK